MSVPASSEHTRTIIQKMIHNDPAITWQDQRSLLICVHVVRASSEDEMIALFLFGELASERFGEGTKGIPARQTIFHQSEMASHLLLPVIPR